MSALIAGGKRRSKHGITHSASCPEPAEFQEGKRPWPPPWLPDDLAAGQQFGESFGRGFRDARLADVQVLQILQTAENLHRGVADVRPLQFQAAETLQSAEVFQGRVVDAGPGELQPDQLVLPAKILQAAAAQRDVADAELAEVGKMLKFWKPSSVMPKQRLRLIS